MPRAQPSIKKVRYNSSHNMDAIYLISLNNGSVSSKSSKSDIYPSAV